MRILPGVWNCRISIGNQCSEKHNLPKNSVIKEFKDKTNDDVDHTNMMLMAFSKSGWKGRKRNFSDFSEGMSCQTHCLEFMGYITDCVDERNSTHI